MTPALAVHGLLPDSKPGLPSSWAGVQAAAVAGAAAAGSTAPTRTAHPAAAPSAIRRTLLLDPDTAASVSCRVTVPIRDDESRPDDAMASTGPTARKCGRENDTCHAGLTHSAPL